MNRQLSVATTRFAPSPTGWLHLGHVHAAWHAWAAARASGGRFLVRLEDIDPARCRPELARGILDDLGWLGLPPDGAVRVQSAHLADYRRVLDTLAAGGLIYPCFCSRAAIARELAASAAAPHEPPAAWAPDGSAAYPGTCRNLSAGVRARLAHEGAPHAWRLDMRAALEGAPALRFVERGVGTLTADPAPFGDVVLGRRDIPASYHLCVTHDDAVQGVTLVTRGDDLRPSTHLHVLLQHLMGWPIPDYAHHGLLLNAHGTRLSKRDGALSVRTLRQAGHDPASVLALAMAGDPD